MTNINCTSSRVSPRRRSRKSGESSSSTSSRRRDSSPFQWRRERPTSATTSSTLPADGADPTPKAEKENQALSSSSRTRTPPRDGQKKSHGISPDGFYKKTAYGGGGGVEGDERPAKSGDSANDAAITGNSSIPAWKERAEHSLLIQEHDKHARRLEGRRRAFRQNTQLKTWPLQDMALEHLDYLSLSCKRAAINGRIMSQFHGGDYLSSESSSSVSSVETSRRRVEKTSPGSPVWDDGRVNARHEATTSSSDPDAASVPLVSTPEQDHPSALWSMEPRIFATEKSQGKRKYLVGQFGRIADWYWRKATPPRHLYEVIRAETPCRLYFDLECSKYHNPDLISPAELLNEFRLELAADLQTYFGLSLEATQIINLDSSTEAKFSRHWIVRLRDDRTERDEGAGQDGNTTSEKSVSEALQLVQQDREVLFRDAPTVGRFVKRLVGRLADEIAVAGGDFATTRPALAKYLFVNTKEANKKTCFVDLGVYTRNRLFRCLGSSKYGKNATLEVMPREVYDGDNSCDRTYYPLELPQQRNEALTRSHNSANLLTPLLSFEEFVAANDWEPHAKALADTLVVPLQWESPTPSTAESNNNSPRILDVPLEGRFAGMTSANCSLTASTGSSGDKAGIHNQPNQQEQHHLQRAFPACIPMSRKGSPLPSLDRFVSQVLAGRGGIQGSIRAWSIEYGPREAPVSITYQMQRNRFCELVGRCHKSNNVFWTVDFGSWTCIQGCHDPDCHGRGSPVPISNPPKDAGDQGRNDRRSILESIQEEYDTWQEEEFEKALMALNLDDVTSKASATVCNSTVSDCDRDQHVNDDESPCALSDEALLLAMTASPELFP